MLGRADHLRRERTFVQLGDELCAELGKDPDGKRKSPTATAVISQRMRRLKRSTGV